MSWRKVLPISRNLVHFSPFRFFYLLKGQTVCMAQCSDAGGATAIGRPNKGLERTPPCRRLRETGRRRAALRLRQLSRTVGCAVLWRVGLVGPAGWSWIPERYSRPAPGRTETGRALRDGRKSHALSVGGTRVFLGGAQGRLPEDGLWLQDSA